MSNAIANDTFTTYFDKTEREVQFDIAWSSKDGHFTNLLKPGVGPEMAVGEVVKCSTPGNRRMMILATPLGPLVVFERFSSEKEPSIISYNATSSFMEGGWYENATVMSAADLEFTFENMNIGKRIDQLYRNCKSMYKQYFS